MKKYGVLKRYRSTSTINDPNEAEEMTCSVNNKTDDMKEDDTARRKRLNAWYRNVNRRLRGDGKANGVLLGVWAALLSVCAMPARATLDVTTTLQTTLTLIFNLMMFGGIILTGYGVVLLAKAISSPDSSDPHGITKGIGAIVGGVIMIAIQSILSLLGVNISSFSLV